MVEFEDSLKFDAGSSCPSDAIALAEIAKAASQQDLAIKAITAVIPIVSTATAQSAGVVFAFGAQECTRDIDLGTAQEGAIEIGDTIEARF